MGAAAGLAAAFNAPIAAVPFLIEEIMGNWSASGLGALMLAAPDWLRYALPALAGGVVGVIGLWYPQVMGAGYVYVDQVLHNQYTWMVLGILGLLKILASGICFTSGTPGGTFAPTLVIGAMIGGSIGGLKQHFFPHTPGSMAAFALVGMGALFGGFLRAPITAVFMVVEISGSYAIILPVMVSTTIAYFIARHYQRVPLFDLLSRQDGVELPSHEELREHEVLSIEAVAESRHSAEGCVLISYPDGRWAAVSGKDLLLRASGEPSGRPVGEVAAPARVPILHPDQPIEHALRLAQEWPVVPVVSRLDQRQLEGVITLHDLLATYLHPPANGSYRGAEGEINYEPGIISRVAQLAPEERRGECMAGVATTCCKRLPEHSCVSCAKCYEAIAAKDGEFSCYDQVDIVGMTLRELPGSLGAASPAPDGRGAASGSRP